jgi:hypothetical protein
VSLPAHRRFSEKRDIVGELVLVSYLQTEGRGLSLELIFSRAVLRGEIHELIATMATARPGESVSDVAYIGFFEVTQGGSLRVGDVLRHQGRPIGSLAGFDLNHFPNHLNLVIRCERLATGRDLGMRLVDEIRFTAE